MANDLSPRALLEHLGITTVVWIDDSFADDPTHLVAALQHAPTVIKGVASFEAAFALLDENGEPSDETLFEETLISALEQATPEDRHELNKRLRTQGAAEEASESKVRSPAVDIGRETVVAICDLLGVAEEHRMDFERGREFVNAAPEAIQNTTAIVVDMMNAIRGGGRDDIAGLKILDPLYKRNGEEITFILTHEAAPETESVREAEYVEKLEAGQRFPCVISKARVQNKADGELSAALNVALKRSALRREVYNIGKMAQDVVGDAVRKTRDDMCQIPPEDLEHAFVKRAISEGVSDLHLIERLIVGQVKKSLQQMFVDHRSMHERIRELRDIPIGTPNKALHEVVARFRYDELWDSEEFLRAGFAPLYPGDIFETVGEGNPRRFILIAQPCDVALRNGMSRKAQYGDLVFFSDLPDGSDPERAVNTGRKTIDLPVGPGGCHLRFDYRKTSPARLAILDFATFRSDGKVMVSKDQVESKALLPKQASCMRDAKTLLDRWISAWNNAQKDKKNILSFRDVDADCRLTLRTDSPFNAIAKPAYQREDEALDWKLRRVGRLRSPYVDLLIDQWVALLNRRALDLDYV